MSNLTQLVASSYLHQYIFRLHWVSSLTAPGQDSWYRDIKESPSLKIESYQPRYLEVAVNDPTYEIHSSDLRRGCFEGRTSIIVWYTCDHDSSIIHDKPKDLFKPALSKLADRHAGLRADTFSRDALELGHIEAFVTLAELFILIPQPALTGVAVVILIVRDCTRRHCSTLPDTACDTETVQSMVKQSGQRTE